MKLTFGVRRFIVALSELSLECSCPFKTQMESGDELPYSKYWDQTR